MLEGHPLKSIWSYEEGDSLKVAHSYFPTPEPEKDEPDRWGTYTENSPLLTTHSYQWQRTLGDIVNALVEAGLKIERLNEYPYDVWRSLNGMERSEDGWFRLKDHPDHIPLLFSLRATK